MSLLARNLVKYGSDITYKQVSGGTFDPGPGEYSGQSTASEDIRALQLIVTTSRRESLALTLKDDGVVFSEIAFLVIQASDLPFVPLPDDTVTLDGRDWTVMAVNNTCNRTRYELALRI
ncbi:MAG: hypothetical protein KAR40_11160 [Candidatus Sabulitectum sp.]|nr:hypothetical protein [Candidatus Sabulitectum sp.]